MVLLPLSLSVVVVVTLFVEIDCSSMATRNTQPSCDGVYSHRDDDDDDDDDDDGAVVTSN